MKREDKIKLLKDVKDGKTTIEGLKQRLAQPKFVVFMKGVDGIDGITVAVDGEKMLYDEFKKRFPFYENSNPIDVSLNFDID